MAATGTLDRRRQLFPTLESGVYLLSHSLGPAPATLDDSMRAYLDEWRHHTTEDAWGAKWWELSRDVGDRIGRLIGAQPGSVQMQPSASVALYAVLSCFDFSRPGKNQVVTTALDFPSMGYIWEGQRRLGADVQVVASENDIVIPMDRLLEAITDRTVLVALSHVSYRSSSRIDVGAVVRRAHEVGAFVVLDAYQSVGILSMDVQRWNVDFLIGGSIKWLCGGPSCGYLYVRPDLIGQFQPRLTGWIAHADPFAFSHEGMKYDQSVRRFAQGTPSIPALYSFLPGLRIIEDVGLDAIERESRRRTRRIVAFAQEHGWRLHSPLEVEQRGGTVMIEVDDPERQVEALAKRGVFVDCRPGVGLRVSPHFFNTDEEVEQALETIGSVIP
ncbi:MAG: aminotransferase class V-fold PLP-dependent enzyme [Planctomycetes bacterium]|nr:aminotransferase class V-fold PLP-dependent enzyme [Planctomycetota bacterium]